MSDFSAEYIIDSFEEAFKEWDNKTIDHICLAWSIQSCKDLRAELARLRALASLVPELVEALEKCKEVLNPYESWSQEKAAIAYQMTKQTLARAREVMEAHNDTGKVE